jgi:cyanophycinase-like exopeptidase
MVALAEPSTPAIRQVDMTGQLVIMGSGDTAPTMVGAHRAALRRAGPGPAILLDTPFGFQENADDITRRAVTYFAHSVQRTVTPLRWRTRLTGRELDRALDAVLDARWVYSGPGSPTYALQVWRASGLGEALTSVVAGGGTVTMASAAALTIGVATVPVYEIYKCGADPHWVDGLNILAALTRLHAAVIPHYNNTEGGTHSTRFCYLGERRLAQLERQLPAGAHLIGVDEHTALVLDLAEETATVVGAGSVTVRMAGASRVLPRQSVVPIPHLAHRPRAHTATATWRYQPVDGTTGPPLDGQPTSLRAAADKAHAEFVKQWNDRNAEAAGNAALDLEQTISAWSADTEQDDIDYARRIFRRMMSQLQESAARQAELAQRLGSLVQVVVEQRERARQIGDFGEADRLRNHLAAAGVDVRDTPDGARWTLLDVAAEPMRIPDSDTAT